MPLFFVVDPVPEYWVLGDPGETAWVGWVIPIEAVVPDRSEASFQLVNIYFCFSFLGKIGLLLSYTKWPLTLLHYPPPPPSNFALTFFSLNIIYLHSRITQRCRSSICCWLSPQMTTVASWAGPKPGAWSFFQFFHVDVGAQELSSSSVAFPGH